MCFLECRLKSEYYKYSLLFIIVVFLCASYSCCYLVFIYFIKIKFYFTPHRLAVRLCSQLKMDFGHPKHVLQNIKLCLCISTLFLVC